MADMVDNEMTIANVSYLSQMPANVLFIYYFF